MQVEYQSDGYTAWGGSNGDGSENPIFTIGDDLTVIKGTPHDQGRLSVRAVALQRLRAADAGGAGAAEPRADEHSAERQLRLGGGNAFASFLLGEINSAQTENDRFVRQYWRGHAAYIQDDWKVSPKLTLNFGLRYDVTLPPLERDDKWSDFDPFTPNPAANGRLGALALRRLRTRAKSASARWSKVGTAASGRASVSPTALTRRPSSAAASGALSD